MKLKDFFDKIFNRGCVDFSKPYVDSNIKNNIKKEEPVREIYIRDPRMTYPHSQYGTTVAISNNMKSYSLPWDNYQGINNQKLNK